MEPTIKERINVDRRGVLSSLWIVVLLSMLFRDIHEIVKPGAIEEYGSMTVSEATFLVAGVVLTAFISMIVLSRVLPHRMNRWANIGVPILAIGAMLANTPRDLDDVWFLAVEVVGLLAIVRIAWTWRSTDAALRDVEPVTLGST